MQMMNGTEKERADMTDKEYRQQVDVLLTLLDYDLNTANAVCCPDDCSAMAELSFSLGVYEECLSQARQHIRWFRERTDKDE